MSGGPDSMALAVLLQEWCAAHGTPLLAITVDHALRVESAAEADAVHRQLAAMGVPHVTYRLAWPDGVPSSSRVSAIARQRRYEALERLCTALGIRRLYTAHTAGDCVETFLMRAARGSGITGLAAMAAESLSPAGITVCRPLARTVKGRLLATAASRHVSFATDRSNFNLASDRVRVRTAVHIMATPAAERPPTLRRRPPPAASMVDSDTSYPAAAADIAAVTSGLRADYDASPAAAPRCAVADDPQRTSASITPECDAHAPTIAVEELLAAIDRMHVRVHHDIDADGA